MKLTANSRIKDLYAHPVGQDLIKRVLLQIGRSDGILHNPLIANLN